MSFKKTTQAFKVVGEFLTDLRDNEKWQDINEHIFDTWKEKELPEIFETGGQNIGVPFPKQKKTKEWRQFRKYNAPQRWLLGVWSGETYHALTDEIDTTNVNIIKNINKRQIYYMFETKEPVNVTIGASKEFLQEAQLYAVGEVGSLIDVLMRNL